MSLDEFADLSRRSSPDLPAPFVTQQFWMCIERIMGKLEKYQFS
jgi:hypothetical protein